MSLKKGLELKRPILLLISVMLIVGMAGVGAAAMPGRYVPTHKITQPVYCGSCHTAQTAELNQTTHLTHFAGGVQETYNQNNADNLSSAAAVSAGCQMCHNNWDTREQLYLVNYTMSDDGTGHYTATWDQINSSQQIANEVGEFDASNKTVYADIDNDSVEEELTRMDAVWANLTEAEKPVKDGHGYSCGDAVDGLTCHASEEMAVMSAEGHLGEIPGEGGHSSSVMFSHNMGSPRMDGSNFKQVKMCAACHYNFIPATAANGTALNDQETFQYWTDNNHNGAVDQGESHIVKYADNDFAHSNVQCVDCHSHASAGSGGQVTSETE